MHEYAYAENSLAEMIEIVCDGPLTLPHKRSSIWKELEHEVDSFIEIINEDVPQDETFIFENSHYNSSVESSMSGTVNLINFIIRSQSTKPIKTLLFLDRSARLGAHIFRVLWSTLERQGKLPPNIVMPAIKFINVGRGEDYKHTAHRSLDLAKKIFPDTIKDGEVVVVDDKISSGDSLRRAMKYLEDCYGVRPQGIAHFGFTPGWFSNDYNRFKGVADPNLPKRIYDLLEAVERDVFDCILAIMSLDLSNESKVELLIEPTRIKLKQYVKKNQNWNDIIEYEDLLFRVDRVLQSLLEEMTPIMIVNFFRSFGGFLALRPDKTSIRMSFRYRKCLTKMVELSSQHIKLTGASSE